MRVFAGAMTGVGLGLPLTTPETPPKDLSALVDTGLARLEAGIKL